MIYSINLSPETESALEVKASRLGMDVEGYLRQLIDKDAQPVNVQPGTPLELSPPIPASPSDIVAYWDKVDAFGAFSDALDSSGLARKLRTNAENRAL